MIGGTYLRFRPVTMNIIFKEVKVIIDEIVVAVDDDWRVGFGVLVIGDFTSGNAGTIVWIFIIVVLLVVVVAHGDIT